MNRGRLSPFETAHFLLVNIVATVLLLFSPFSLVTQREYQTTQREDFETPSLRCTHKAGPGRKTLRRQQGDPWLCREPPTMTQPCTVKEAMRPRPIPDEAFGSIFSRARHEGSQDTGDQAETIPRSASDVPEQRSKTKTTAVMCQQAPGALPGNGILTREVSRANLGIGGEKIVRPQAVTFSSKPVGERFMEGDDPTFNTAAQRAWVYSHDPVIKYHSEGIPIAQAVDGLSISIGTNQRRTSGSFQRSRTVTRESEPNFQRGSSVWIDFHIGPGEA